MTATYIDRRNGRLLLHADLFALRDRSTGRYMPQLRGRGYCLLEIEDWSPSQPRLFWSRSGAVRALASWRRGPLSKSSSTRDYFGEWDYDPGGEPLSNTPPENRVAAQVDIVPFTLQEES